MGVKKIIQMLIITSACLYSNACTEILLVEYLEEEAIDAMEDVIEFEVDRHFHIPREQTHEIIEEIRRDICVIA